MSWLRFVRHTIVLTVVMLAAVWAASLLVDPYNLLSFSIPAERAAFYEKRPFILKIHPGLIGRGDFDSAIIGDSAAETFNPLVLNQAFGTRFVNLSFAGATAWEQQEILGLFLRRQPRPDYVLFEISDLYWCAGGGRGPGWKDGRGTAPVWSFDDNEWNDLLPHLTLSAARDALSQALYLAGLKEALPIGAHRLRLDPPEPEMRKLRFSQFRPADISPAGFPEHEFLRTMTAALPPSTVRIVVFVPLNAAGQPPEGSPRAERLEACKRSIAEIAWNGGNAHVLDFMIDSELTRDEENFYDPGHLLPEAADRLMRLIGQGVREHAGVAGLFRYLEPSDFN